MLVVFTTTPNAEESGELAGKIVEARLAGCVQVLPGVSSVYIWEGEVRSESEHLLLIKTLPEKFDELEAFITEHHSYDVPEVVAVDSARASAKYLEWLEACVR